MMLFKYGRVKIHKIFAQVIRCYRLCCPGPRYSMQHPPINHIGHIWVAVAILPSNWILTPRKIRGIVGKCHGSWCQYYQPPCYWLCRYMEMCPFQLMSTYCRMYTSENKVSIGSTASAIAMLRTQCSHPCKVHRANMGPTWGRQDPGGPHVSHTNLAIWDLRHNLVIAATIKNTPTGKKR